MRGTTKAAIVLTPLGAAGLLLIRSGRAPSVGRAARAALHRGPGSARRYLAGVGRGVAYRLRGGGPDPAVDDDVLADRVRSSLGRLEHHLDIPRVHVMVRDHVVRLDGDVHSAAQVAALEAAVLDIPGVNGVDAHLHVGLLRGDTAPSEGGAFTGPSRVLQRLQAAARSAGVAEDRQVTRVVGSVLSELTEFLPDETRSHLLAHLPSDVRSLTRPGSASRGERAHSGPEFASHVATATGLDEPAAGRATHAVFRALHQLVPEEVEGIEAVLPAGIRESWAAAAER